jgi:hypothetical protein
LRRSFTAADLSDLYDADATAGTDVRLRVHGSHWQLLSGSADYDQDHRGHWGAGFLPYGRSNLADLARDLIEQAKDMHADSESADRYYAAQKEARLLKGAGLHPSQTGFARSA